MVGNTSCSQGGPAHKQPPTLTDFSLPSTPNLRLSCMTAVFPFVRHAGVAENVLDAHHAVGSLAVMTAFVESVTLRAVEKDYTQA